MRRGIARLALLTLVAGCDGLTTGPTQPDSAGPVALVGTYQSSSFWTASVLSGPIALYTRTCPGSVVVETQSGEDWSGTFASRAPCPAKAGKVHGTADGSGRVTMLFDGVTISDTPYGAGPCPDITFDLSGAPVLAGRLNQGSLELSIETTARCLQPQVTATVKLEAKGSRQP